MESIINKKRENQMFYGILIFLLLVFIYSIYSLTNVISSPITAHVTADSPDELLSNSGAPSLIEIKESIKDIGIIKQSPELIKTSFEFSNIGDKDLIIDYISTSCMCTSAVINYNGEKSPVFGGKSPTSEDYELVLPPGKTATVEVSYDPMAHGIQKEDRQDMVRVITLYTNDPSSPQVQLRVKFIQAK